MSDLQWWCAALGVPWTWEWRPYPGVWLFVLALALAYWLPARGVTGAPPTSPARRAAGVAGLLLVWAALDWPVGALGGGYLASAHTMQYLALALLAPPLLIAGMPPGTRERLERGRVARPLLRALTHPARATLLYVVVFLATHAPAVADRLMPSQAGAFLIDAAWLGSGLLYWWPLVGVPPGRAPLALPARIACLIAGAVPHTPVAMWLLITAHPVYATYELAPRVTFGDVMLDARTDQQLAGGLMILVGGLFVLGVLTTVFMRWHGVGEERRGPAIGGPATSR